VVSEELEPIRARVMVLASRVEDEEARRLVTLFIRATRHIDIEMGDMTDDDAADEARARILKLYDCSVDRIGALLREQF
jgi:hypothetical protein